MPCTNPFMHRKGPRAVSEMQIRNEYSEQFGIQNYLIVEGESDEHFFENILNCKICKVRNVEGKPKVKDFIKKQNKNKKKGYLGIVDADFEHITKYEEKIDNIILTDFHDIEMLILSSHPDMRKIYSELTDNIFIKSFEDKHGVTFIQSVINVAYEIGLLKLVLDRPKYHISIKDFPYIDIINDDFCVDIDKLINRIRGKNFTLFEIKADFNEEKEKTYEQYQVCCGHDVTNILAICFMAKEEEGLGYGRQKFIDKRVIERLLRVVYDYNHFLTTNMYKEINEWEKNNSIMILDRSVISVTS